MHVACTIDLITLAREKNIPQAEEFISQIEQAQEQLANLVAKNLQVEHHRTTIFEDEIGSEFGPATSGQVCPPELAITDESSCWALGLLKEE